MSAVPKIITHCLSVSTSGSEISTGASPRVHLFAANQPFEKQLEEKTVKAQGSSSSPHMWNIHVVSARDVGNCDRRGLGEFLHLLGCCAMEQTHFMEHYKTVSPVD